MELPKTRYARSGDLSIAYQVVGEGPLDIVFVPGFISHLELNWESPFYGRVLERFARIGRLIAFDKRGTGLSDRTEGFGSLEERMDDIRAVMDAAGSERACIGGISEGGPLSVMFAASYPERVEKLVLYGSFARMTQASDYPLGYPIEVYNALCDEAERFWGTGDVLMRFVPDADPDAIRSLLARFERYSMTPAMVGRILRQMGDIDVRPLLGSVQVPTLVIHAEGDPMAPVHGGRYLATHIPGAEYTEFADVFHASVRREVNDMVMDRIEQFFFGRVVDTAEPDRVLMTIMFTDIVDSTGRAASLGDGDWRELLERHHRISRDEISRHRGREVKTMGDGFLATFDGPARAIRCAQTIAARTSADLGLTVRAGVHTGECELHGDDIAGIAVHVGARVMAAADGTDVLVTRTVRDLVAGSGITLESRGERTFKGVGDPIEVYAAVS